MVLFGLFRAFCAIFRKLPQRPQSYAAVALFLTGSSGAVLAQDDLPGWYAARISGSDRLAFYAAGRAGIGEALPELAYRTGGAHQGVTPQIVARDMSVRPILNYATNFNGGIPGATIELFDRTTYIDDASRAKSGLVAGGSVSGGVVASYRTGSLVRLTFGTSAEWLIGEGLRRQQAGVSACAQHHIGGWTWIDGCATAARVWRNYDTHVSQQSISVGPTILYSTGNLDQQISLKAMRLFLEDGPQNAVRAEWTGAFPALGAVQISGELAEEVDPRPGLSGTNTPLRTLSLGLIRPVYKRIMSFDLTYTETGGARPFGIVRKDRVLTFGISAPVTEGFSVGASIGRRNSTMQVYEESFAHVSGDLHQW